MRDSAATSYGDGRYMVEKTLGRGAQKVVYLVHDRSLDRRCALAAVRPDGISASRLDRIRREARAMARLGAHPNIVTVHDIGEQNGAPFMVCEHVGGGDLEGLLKASGKMTPDRVTTIAKDLCRALAFTHSHGIIHRDVKPSNVWLTEDGRVKLGDFGLALAVDEARLTAEGGIVGTPYYLAPELALSGTADARTDLYSLGCVLYELLGGSPPFSGSTVVEVVAQHVHASPRPLQEIDPSLDVHLTDVVLALLQKDPDDRPASASAVLEMLEHGQRQTATDAPPAPAPLSRFARADLVGRDEELDRLKEWLDATRAGSGVTCAIGGESGVGKTRLVRELRTYARLRGARVLSGCCEPADGSLPYLPFVEALDAVSGELSSSRPETAILARILPGLRTRLGSSTPLEDEALDRYDVFRAVAATLRDLAAGRGLLLLVEDVHWADKGSLLLLEHLARNIDESGLMLAMTFRDDEVSSSSPLGETLTSLRRHPSHHRLALRRLEEDAARALIGGYAPLSSSAVDAIIAQTEGHPLFIEEVLKHLSEEGVLRRFDRGEADGRVLAAVGVPRGIRDVIGRRLGRLGEPCHRMLRTASALPGAIRWPLLVRICDSDEDELLDCLDEALTAHILSEKKGPGDEAYEFTHAMIRQTLYEELSAPRRTRLHRRVGEALEALYKSNLDGHLGELAFHFFRASDEREKAADYAARAGAHSMRSLAYEDAALQFERALVAHESSTGPEALVRRAELHGLRGVALATMSLWADARTQFQAALDVLPEHGHDEQRARLLLHSAIGRFWTMDVPGLCEDARKALEVAERCGDPKLIAAANAFLANADHVTGQVHGSEQRYARAAAEAGEIIDPLLGQSLQNYPVTLYWLGRTEQVIEQAERLLPVARAQHDGSMVMNISPVMALSLASRGRYREAHALFEKTAAFGRDHKIWRLQVRAMSMSTGPCLDLFDVPRARTLAAAAVERATELGFPPPAVSARIDLMFAALDEGDVGSADRLLPGVREAVLAASGWHGWVWAIRFALVNARLALAHGDWVGAETAARDTIERAATTGRAKHEAAGYAALGLALFGRGDKHGALAAQKRGLEIAASLSYPALVVRFAAESLEVEPDEAVARLGAEAVARVSTGVAGTEYAAAFARSRSVGQIEHLAPSSMVPIV